MSTPRVYNLSVERPSARDALAGEQARAVLRVDRGLKSGRLDEIPLERADLLRLAAQATSALAALDGVRP